MCLFTEYGTTSFTNDVTELELEESFPTEPQGKVIPALLQKCIFIKYYNYNDIL